MRYEAELGPEEVLSEKPFTDPANTEREVDVMRVMLEEERALVRDWAEAGDEAPTEVVLRDSDDEGHRRLLVVPSTRALAEAANVSAIGFFGRPREGIDHAILFGLEDELVERMAAYADAGLLSYYDVELVAPKGTYGNLILFATPDVPEAWYGDEVHNRAVQLAPGHYHEVRLHKGTVAGSILDGSTIEVERTKYFDFGGAEVWHALRRFRG
jgi:hypothetical protein